jgi:spore germination protein GerM
MSEHQTVIGKPTRMLLSACVLVIASGCGTQPLIPTPTPIDEPIPPVPGVEPCSDQDAPPSTDGGTVLVFFTCGSGPIAPVVAVVRPAESDAIDDRLAAAVRGLLGGPTTDEKASGLRSWFSDATANRLNGVQIGDNGRAIVDFADFSAVIPNASTTEGRRQLMTELRSTIFQFDDVQSVEFWFDGSCDAFWAWLDAPCTPMNRDG